VTVSAIDPASLQAALPQSSSAANAMTIQAGAGVTPATVIQAVNGLANVTEPVTIVLDLGGGTYSSDGTPADPPPNVDFRIVNGTLDPDVPALTVAGGQVTVLNCTLITSGDAPTLLVTGGSLTLRNDVVRQSSSFADAAVALTGGTLDLGTTASPGGNTLSVNGAGTLVLNTTANAIPAAGNSFTVNGTPLAAPTLSFTAVASSAASATFGQAVTLTATVRPDGTGTPTGSVDFLDTSTNTDLGSVALSGGTAALTTTALGAGTHVILARYGGDATFLPGSGSATQTVLPARPGVTVADAGGTYCGTAHAAAGTVAGVGGAAGSTLEGVGLTFTYYPGSTTGGTSLAGAPVDAGTYTVVAHFAGSGDYAAADSDPLTFAVAKAPLTVTAADKTKVYGSTNPTLNGTLAGVVNGDAITATYASAATQFSDVVSGGYVITVALNDPNGRLGNYVITQNGGTLMITRADPTISWATPAAITYGTPLGATQLNATVAGVPGGAAPGAPTYSPSAGAVLGPGPQTLTVTAAATQDYNAATATVTLPVRYAFSGFLPPLTSTLAFGLNRTIPVKFQLGDASGNLITALGAVAALQVQPVDAHGSPLGAPFNPTSADGTSLQNSGGQYLFNWQTKGLGAGYYKLLLTLADGTTQTKLLQLSANGGGNLIADSGGAGSSASAGALLAGDLTLYVDNSSGAFTADELARVDDAVAALNLVVGPYGATLVEVGAADSTTASVVVHIAATCALGGAADGVLGCEDGDITLISGWDWFSGANPAAVGAGQYDFETIVLHELGHALGLGHSADDTSVMYATLAAGVARRALLTADLNIPDGDGGPCGLHATFAPAGASAPSLVVPDEVIGGDLPALLQRIAVPSTPTATYESAATADPVHQEAALRLVLADWPTGRSDGMPLASFPSGPSHARLNGTHLLAGEKSDGDTASEALPGI
jgi:hypothetical protein